MSSGNIQVGVVGQPYYFKRVWSGDNGRFYTGTTISKWNPYSLRLEQDWRKSGLLWQLVGTPYQNCSGNDIYGSCYSGPQHTWRGNDDLKLIANLGDKIRGHSFNLGTFAATSRQAVGQTVSTVHAFTRAFISLKKGNISDALKYVGLTPGQRSVKRVKSKLDAGDLSGAWLAMQYGWLPTISDIHEGMKAFSEVADYQRKTTVRVSNTVRAFKMTSPNQSWYLCGISSYRTKRYTYTLMENDPQKGSPSAVPSKCRTLGLMDPASVVWEILPWSFVFDWFIPVGTYLEALQVPYLVERSRLASSDMEKWQGSIDWVYSGFCKRPDASSRGVTYSRAVNSALEIPKPNFVGLDEAISGKRIFNAIALAHQKVRGSNGKYGGLF